MTIKEKIRDEINDLELTRFRTEYKTKRYEEMSERILELQKQIRKIELKEKKDAQEG